MIFLPAILNFLERELQNPLRNRLRFILYYGVQPDWGCDQAVTTYVCLAAER
jgi:hypothetical protein